MIEWKLITDLKMINNFGLSAIDSASNNNNSDVVEYLIKYYDILDKI